MYDINKYITPEAKEVTEANFVGKLSSQIKHYPQEPIYYLRVNKQNCLIEVLINDVKLYNDYELSNFVTPRKIAGKILKSGKQEVTVRMYPVENLVNESYGREGEPITKLLDNSTVNIKVVLVDNQSEKGFDDEELVTEHKSPVKEGKFIGTGKPYYEYTFTFNAEVPYEFEGWTNGQDLRKLDQKLLAQKALEFYKMVQDIYVNKDLDAWLKLEYLGAKRTVASIYVDKDYLNELLKEYQDEFSYNYTSIPISDYKINLRGENKLILLNHTSSDSFYRGAGAAELEYTDEDGDLAGLIPSIILYLPKGRKLEDGLMVWK